MVFPVFTSTQDLESMEADLYKDLKMAILDFLEENPDWTPYMLAEEIGCGVTRFQRWIEGRSDDAFVSLRSLYKLHLLGISAGPVQYHFQVGPLDLPERPENATYPEVTRTVIGPGGRSILTLETENDLGDPVKVTMTSSCVRAMMKVLDGAP